MQEAWIKIFNNLGKVDNPDTFYPWCKRIVINTALRSLQHRWLKTDLTDTIESLDQVTGPSILDDLSHEAIREVINQLPEGYRDIFLLHHVDGYKHEEIGKMFNIAASTSRAKLSIARKRLRDILNQKKMAI
jgi:RNA polymerase sigma-70 factor (ECF subfamily)